MVLGFVVIIYPNKYISYPDVNDSNSPQEKPQMNEGFTNETIDEISGFPIQASNISDVKTIESGNISSTERFHYQERLKDLQDEGVEGMTEKECSILSDVFCSCYLTYNIHTFLNLLLTSFNECNITYFSSYNYRDGNDCYNDFVGNWSEKGKYTILQCAFKRYDFYKSTDIH